MKKEHTDRGQRVACTAGCGLDFIDQKGMEIHLKTIHNSDVTFPCPKCDVPPFGTSQKLINHDNIVHLMKFRCPYPDCPKHQTSFSSNQRLQHHINLPLDKKGHGGVAFTTELNTLSSKEDQVVPEITGNKRKVDELDPVSMFLDTKKGYFKDMYSPKKCSNFLCIITRLAWGFPGGEKLYCSNHRDDVQGLVYLGDNRSCKFIGCPTLSHITIGEYRFCDSHVKQLIQEGLPSPEENVKKPKDSGRRCVEEGCELYSSFDNGQYCYKHSPTKVSDDKRMCEVPGCENNKRPTFGYLGGPRTRCRYHRKRGMYSHKLCSFPGCKVSAHYGPEGGLPLTCVHHKEEGYINVNAAQCAMACCADGDGVQAKFFHIGYGDESSDFFGKRICTFGRRVMIEDAIQKNDINELSRLMDFYELDKVTTLNAQSAFRFECEQKYHDLLGNCVDIVFDGHVHEGPKTLWSKRPDIFYKFVVNGVNYGIHIEYDETSGHEDDPVRLRCIEENAGCEGRVYLIRVNGGHDSKNPACTRVEMTNYSYYVVTHEGRQVASMVSDAVVDRIRWIEEGLGPGDGRPAKIII